MYQIVPEEVIKDAADKMRDQDPLNSFHFLLEEGELYKEADLIPVYIINMETQEVMVTSTQCMDKNYH